MSVAQHDVSRRTQELPTLVRVVTPRWLRQRRREQARAARRNVAADVADQIVSRTMPGRELTLDEIIRQQNVKPFNWEEFRREDSGLTSDDWAGCGLLSGPSGEAGHPRHRCLLRPRRASPRHGEAGRSDRRRRAAPDIRIGRRAALRRHGGALGINPPAASGASHRPLRLAAVDSGVARGVGPAARGSSSGRASAGTQGPWERPLDRHMRGATNGLPLVTRNGRHFAGLAELEVVGSETGGGGGPSTG